jgi:nitroreductase
MPHPSPLQQPSAAPCPACDSGEQEVEDFACTLIASRQHVSPQRLVEPGPGAAQLARMLAAAAAAPDHGQLTPWRFVIVPKDKRVLLAEVFAQALTDRDAGATAKQIGLAREKAHRAPLLMLAVARLGRHEPDIPAEERLVSLGCALQNMLLVAHAMGYGAGLTAGRAMNSPRLRELFALADGERAVCCINVGSPTTRRPMRLRPAPAAIVSSL